jgi:hypothetical protein
MKAAEIINEARKAGLNLAISESGSLKVCGPRAAVTRLTPVLSENKPAILTELCTHEAALSADNRPAPSRSRASAQDTTAIAKPTAPSKHLPPEAAGFAKNPHWVPPYRPGRARSVYSKGACPHPQRQSRVLPGRRHCSPRPRVDD